MKQLLLNRGGGDNSSVKLLQNISFENDQISPSKLKHTLAAIFTCIYQQIDKL